MRTGNVDKQKGLSDVLMTTDVDNLCFFKNVFKVIRGIFLVEKCFNQKKTNRSSYFRFFFSYKSIILHLKVIIINHQLREKSRIYSRKIHTYENKV